MFVVRVFLEKINKVLISIRDNLCKSEYRHYQSSGKKINKTALPRAHNYVCCLTSQANHELIPVLENCLIFI
jgi:hypothetical protein